MMVAPMPMTFDTARVRTRAVFVALAYGLVLCSTSVEVRSEQANQARSEGEGRERPHEAAQKSAAPPQDQAVRRNDSGSRGLSREEREQLRRDVEEYGREIYRTRGGEKPRGAPNDKRPPQKGGNGR